MRKLEGLRVLRPSQLETRLEAEGWEVISIPAIANDNGKPDILGRKPGESFWEERELFKIESLLSKDQILELYMNQIYLGARSYGFAAAADAYFGKPLDQLSIAEAAMLAGAVCPPLRITARPTPTQIDVTGRYTAPCDAT